jgi:hypothetical protein
MQLVFSSGPDVDALLSQAIDEETQEQLRALGYID